jgi:hypothetical protein
MKQKLIIGFSLLLFVFIVVLISTDLFKNSGNSDKNEYAYDLEKYKKIDTSLICYDEVFKMDIELPELNAIAIDNASLIYIASNNIIVLYDNSFNKLLKFQTDSTINAIAANNNSNLYLGINDHVEVYTKNGFLIKKWKPYSNKSYITSIAFNNGFIYVADAGNQLVFKYSDEGQLLDIYGKKDKEKGFAGFIIPSDYFDIAFGSDDKIWIANTGMHKLQQFSDDGDLLASWGSTSMELKGFAGCCNPTHFCILPSGNFVTYEKGLDRIKIYSPNGKFQCVVSGPTDDNSEAASNCSIGALVHDMAVDKNGDIYVIEASNIVKVFRRK